MPCALNWMGLPVATVGTPLGGLHSGVGVIFGVGEPLVGTGVGVMVGGDPSQIRRLITDKGVAVVEVLLPPPPQLKSSAADIKEITGMRMIALRSHNIGQAPWPAHAAESSFATLSYSHHNRRSGRQTKKAGRSIEGGYSINARHDSRLSGANDRRGCREELATGERLGKHSLTN